MAERGRKIIWTENAINSRKSIFKYWNSRNKSTAYSKKLNSQFLLALTLISKFPKIATSSEIKDVRLKVVSNYYLIYQLTESNIIVLDIWDTRQNPEHFPIQKKNEKK
jgi:addiction module RelE/StbE family toxin